jgi:hypothetical protein
VFYAEQDTEHTPQRCQILDFLPVGRRMGPGTRFSNCDQISGKELWFHISLSATYRIGTGTFQFIIKCSRCGQNSGYLFHWIFGFLLAEGREKDN